MKSHKYYSYARKEIVELVVKTGLLERVLDVGCGFGNTGMLLKERGVKRVEGIEIVPEACDHARFQLDRVFQGSAEDENLLSTLSIYDCIICADVLEHMIDPWTFLAIIKDHLKENGRLICSLPNVRYFKVILKLLLWGEWEYQEAGILDKTHLRFFTRKSIKSMFNQAGYDCILVRQKLRKLTIVVNFLTFGVFSDFFPIKFYVIARPTKL